MAKIGMVPNKLKAPSDVTRCSHCKTSLDSTDIMSVYISKEGFFCSTTCRDYLKNGEEI